jgi:hypothetical protein
VRGGWDQSLPAATVEELTARVRFNLEAMGQELAELRDHLPWKEWKSYPSELLASAPASTEAYGEVVMEAIDVLHFLNNVFLALGMTDQDVERAYYAKIRENMKRQETTYANGGG